MWEAVKRKFVHETLMIRVILTVLSQINLSVSVGSYIRDARMKIFRRVLTNNAS